MNITFRCKHLELDKGVWVKEPIMPITLIGPTGIKLNFSAILDSGSDFVLLPLEVAEALKLKLNKKNKDKGKMFSGNTITTTQSKVKINIKKQRQKTTIECKCAVWLNKNQQHEHIIIGSSFFEHFKIIFDYPKNKFQIKK